MSNNQSRQFCQILMSCIDDAVITCDSDGNNILLNDLAKALLGIDSEFPADSDPFEGIKVIDIATDSLLEDKEQIHLQLLRSKTISNKEFKIITPNGNSRIVVANGDTIFSENGEVIGAIVRLRDISVRMHSEPSVDKPQRNNNNLGDNPSNLDLELESFLYSISHDLQAPLRHIKGFSGLLASEYSDGMDESGRQYIERVQKACNQMQQQIFDLLQLSRKTRGKMFISAVNLSNIISSIAGELQQSDPDRKVTFNIAENLEAVGDQRLLLVLCRQLVENAWKFTSRKEEAIIEFGVEEKHEGTRCYYIRDNGVGFDTALANKLFLPFRKLHGNEFDGNGIGLATVLRIINRHRGRVWAEAVQGKGATFYFCLGC